jgi:CRISPR-associated exonuclease Cas4
MNPAVFVAVLILAAGVSIILYAQKLSKQTEYHSRVVYTDGVRLKPAKGISGERLISQRYGIAGKPDQIIVEGGHYIPVELKSSDRPRRPYRGHVLQLAAYCLILEDVTGRPVPYGYLQYRGGEPFKIVFDDLLREELLRTVEEMRRVLAGAPVRKTGNPNKCRNCSVRHACT